MLKIEKHQNAIIQCGKFKSELEKEQNSVKEQAEQNTSLKDQVSVIIYYILLIILLFKIEKIESQLSEL